MLASTIEASRLQRGTFHLGRAEPDGSLVPETDAAAVTHIAVCTPSGQRVVLKVLVAEEWEGVQLVAVGPQGRAVRVTEWAAATHLAVEQFGELEPVLPLKGTPPTPVLMWDGDFDHPTLTPGFTVTGADRVWRGWFQEGRFVDFPT